MISTFYCFYMHLKYTRKVPFPVIWWLHLDTPAITQPVPNFYSFRLAWYWWNWNKHPASRNLGLSHLYGYDRSHGPVFRWHFLLTFHLLVNMQRISAIMILSVNISRTTEVVISMQGPFLTYFPSQGHPISVIPGRVASPWFDSLFRRSTCLDHLSYILAYWWIVKPEDALCKGFLCVSLTIRPPLQGEYA